MKEILQTLGTWKFWKELIIMSVAMLIAAAAVYYFLMPSNLVIGSITGLSMVISGLFGLAGMTVKVSVVVTIINAILLVLAWFLIGAEFGAKTVYTALILGPFIEFWDKVFEKYWAPAEAGLNYSFYEGNDWTTGMKIIRGLKRLEEERKKDA